MNNPRVSVYAWSSSGFGSKYSDPSTLPVGHGVGVKFNPDGDVILVAEGTHISPHVKAYVWNNGFGSKYSDPSTSPTSDANDVASVPTAMILLLRMIKVHMSLHILGQTGLAVSIQTLPLCQSWQF